MGEDSEIHGIFAFLMLYYGSTTAKAGRQAV